MSHSDDVLAYANELVAIAERVMETIENEQNAMRNSWEKAKRNNEASRNTLKKITGDLKSLSEAKITGDQLMNKIFDAVTSIEKTEIKCREIPSDHYINSIHVMKYPLAKESARWKIDKIDYDSYLRGLNEIDPERHGVFTSHFDMIADDFPLIKDILTGKDETQAPLPEQVPPLTTAQEKVVIKKRQTKLENN